MAVRYIKKYQSLAYRTPGWFREKLRTSIQQIQTKHHLITDLAKKSIRKVNPHISNPVNFPKTTSII